MRSFKIMNVFEKFKFEINRNVLKWYIICFKFVFCFFEETIEGITYRVKVMFDYI